MKSRTNAVVLLAVTFVLGLTLGGLLTGAVVQKRLYAIEVLRSEQGFADRIEELVQPESANQRDAIRPILNKAGASVAAAYNQASEQISVSLDEMETELMPYLSDAQLQRFKERREQVQNRVRQSD